jgi:predicted RNase H-like HicB family nuclease
MSTIAYVAVVEGSEKTGYSAFFPDLPGCATAAQGLAELIANARDVLALHIEGMVEDGADVPSASSIEALPIDKNLREAGRIIVDVEIDDAPLRVNVSIGANLLRRIDAAAEVSGMTRSGLLATAARQFVDRFRTPTIPSTNARYLVVPSADDHYAVIWDREKNAPLDIGLYV